MRNILDDDDDDSLEDHHIEHEGEGDLLASDISDSTDTEGEQEDNSDISVSKKDSDSETEDSLDNKDKVEEETRTPSPNSDEGTAKTEDDTEVPERKKKGKKYDYATKLNYLFRDARFFLVKSNNPENVSLAKVRNANDGLKVFNFLNCRANQSGRHRPRMKQSSIKPLLSLGMFC